MEFKEEFTLVRDTTATVIPAGEEQVIPAGTRVTISQALGDRDGKIDQGALPH